MAARRLRSPARGGLVPTSVLFGGNPATIVSNTDYQGTDTLVVINPESTGDAEQYVNVSVTTPYGTSTVAYGYGYYLPPTVTGLSQSSGPLGGGTWLTITGTNLEDVPAVDFGPNVAIPNYYFTNDTQIQLFVPAGSQGTVDVQVLGLGGLSLATPADQFTYVAAPVVTNVSPNAGPDGGGTSVTVYGTGLDNASSVVFNDGQGDVFPAAIVTGSNSDNQIVVTSPDAYSGTYDIIVTTNGGTSYTSPADQFTYVVSPAVSGRQSRLRASARAANQVTITGTNLADATAVDFGSVPAAGFTVNADGSITATTPAGSDGIVDATVVTPGGTSPTSSADEFAYIQPQPVIDGVSPSAGVVGGGSQVTITGTDLDNASVVDFTDSQGDVYQGTIVADSTTQLVVTSPAGSLGTVDLTVTTTGEIGR